MTLQPAFPKHSVVSACTVNVNIFGVGDSYFTAALCVTVLPLDGSAAGDVVCSSCGALTAVGVSGPQPALDRPVPAPIANARPRARTRPILLRMNRLHP